MVRRFPTSRGTFVKTIASPRFLTVAPRETHKANDWKQLTWKDNCKQVKQRAEALVATELNRPLPTQVSLESIGLVEVAYPGIEQVPTPAEIFGILPTNESRQRLKKTWPQYLAALLDTLRLDGAVGWSEDDPNDRHKWEDDSPLHNRWAARDGSGLGRNPGSPAVRTVNCAGGLRRGFSRRPAALTRRSTRLAAIYCKVLLMNCTARRRTGSSSGLTGKTTNWMRTSRSLPLRYSLTSSSFVNPSGISTALTA